MLGVALLLLPPGLAPSSFNHRPDAALGGVLLLIAAVRALRDEPASRARCSPRGCGVATTRRGRGKLAASLQDYAGGVMCAPFARSHRHRRRGALLPPGGRTQPGTRGPLPGESSPGRGALRESLDALNRQGGGLLLLPLALAATRRSRVPARCPLPWGAAAGLRHSSSGAGCLPRRHGCSRSAYLASALRDPRDCRNTRPPNGRRRHSSSLCCSRLRGPAHLRRRTEAPRSMARKRSRP